MIPLIEPGHLFSQHSLNTYLRCPRRFLLKYLEQQPWPMPEDDDPRVYQEHLARGTLFHQWLAREHLGLHMESMVAACEDPQLVEWWRAASRFDRDLLPTGLREAELPVVVPLGAYRLYARYDYVALDPRGEAVVVDWKTLEVLPPLRTLRERVQTRVYLYTLVAAGHVLTGGVPIDPGRARMTYWFANYPDEPVSVPYSRAAFDRDGRYLTELVEKIAGQPHAAFTPTEHVQLCARCNYRSFCRRGGAEAAGEDWLDEDIDFGLDLDEVPEVEF